MKRAKYQIKCNKCKKYELNNEMIHYNNKYTCHKCASKKTINCNQPQIFIPQFIIRKLGWEDLIIIEMTTEKNKVIITKIGEEQW